MRENSIQIFGCLVIVIAILVIISILIMYFTEDNHEEVLSISNSSYVGCNHSYTGLHSKLDQCCKLTGGYHGIQS